MGCDKALMELAGKPLIRHAVKKLRRVCTDVRILSNNEELEAFAPIVRDIHPGCGPMSGIEAALQHSPYEWNLILPVDVPFLPTALLDVFARSTIDAQPRGARIGLFNVDDVPQPTLLVIHKDVLPFLSAAIKRREYKMFPVLRAAGADLSNRERLIPPNSAMRLYAWGPERVFQVNPEEVPGDAWMVPTEAQQAAKQLWFANLNTPEEFAEAERHVDALDT